MLKKNFDKKIVSHTVHTPANYLSGLQGHEEENEITNIGPAGTCSTTCSVFVHLTPEQPPAFIH